MSFALYLAHGEPVDLQAPIAPTLNPDREPWRPAYDAFCEAMDWTGEEPAVVPLFNQDEVNRERG